MNRKYTIPFLILWLLQIVNTGLGQTRKITLGLQGGVFLPMQAQTLNKLEEESNLVGGFNLGPYVLLNGYYHFKNGLLAGADVSYFHTGKANFKVDGVGSHIRAGFSFFPNAGRIWPHVFIGAGYTSLSVTRQAISMQQKVDAPSFEAKEIAINEVVYTYPEITKTKLAPSFEAGLGIDVLLHNNLSLGIETKIGYVLTQNKFTYNSFPLATTHLPFVSASLGVSYSIPYTNESDKIYAHSTAANTSEYKFVKSQTSKLPYHNTFSDNQMAASLPGYIGEPKETHFITKMSFKPDKKISILGKVHNSKRLSEMVVLTNSEGEALRAPTSYNFFAFSGLEPDYYKIGLEYGAPHITSEIKIIEEEPMMRVLEEDFRTYKYEKIKNNVFNGVIVGRIKDVSTYHYPKVDHTVLLVNDKDLIVGKTIANSEGYFAFTNLKESTYTALVETPSENLKAEIKVADNNPVLRIDPTSGNKRRSPTITVTGKVIVKDGRKLQDVAVLLIDSKGDVFNTQPDQHGFYAFKDLNNEQYQILLASPDPAVKLTVHPVTDITQLATEGYFMLKNNFHPNRSEANNVIIGKIDVKERFKSLEELQVMLLNNEGVVKETKPTPEGYFGFNRLKADDYKAVVNTGSGIQTTLYLPVNDPKLKFDSKNTRTYNPETKSFERLQSSANLFISGNIKRDGSGKQQEEYKVFLMDSTGSIEAVTNTDGKGNFFFVNKKPVFYQVLFEAKPDNDYKYSVVAYSTPVINNTQLKLVKTITFKENSTLPKDSSSKLLNSHYKIFQTANAITIRVFGGMEEVDDSESLNRKRIQELKAKLLAQKIPPSKIKIEDWGLPLQRQGIEVHESAKHGRIEMLIE